MRTLPLFNTYVFNIYVRFFRTILCFFAFASFFLLSFDITFSHFSFNTAQAESRYSAGIVIGDGKNGRVWRQWKTSISDKPVNFVDIKLRKSAGGDEAFVNLRYQGERSFENGKRVFLKDNSEKTVRWFVGGEKPNHRKLLLNAYKGEVYVESVVVHYSQPQAATSSVRPLPPSANALGDGSRKPVKPTRTTEEINSEYQTIQRCKKRRSRDPKIEIDEVKKSGGLFSGKYRINGAVFASCVEEVGYYERGKLVKKLDFSLSDSSKREEFSFQVRSGRNGQIRVYTVAGEAKYQAIDDLIKDSP